MSALNIKNDLVPVLMINDPSHCKRDDRESGTEEQVFHKRQCCIVDACPEEAYIMIERVKRHQHPEFHGEDGDRIEDRGQIHPCYQKNVINIEDVVEKDRESCYRERYSDREQYDEAYCNGQ